MDQIYKGLLHVEKIVRKIVLAITCTLIVFITVIIFVQVIFRYILHNSLSWSEELTKYCMVWIVFIGTGYVLGQGAHSNMDIVLTRLPEKLRFWVNKFNSLLLVFFSYVILRYGSEFVMLGTKQKSSALKLPMNIVYLAIPIGGALLLFYSLLLLLKKEDKKL